MSSSRLFQEVINLLPDVTSPQFVEAHNVQTNDQLMCVYMGSLVRTVIALHNLIDNKVCWFFKLLPIFLPFFFVLLLILTVAASLLLVITAKSWERKGKKWEGRKGCKERGKERRKNWWCWRRLNIYI